MSKQGNGAQWPGCVLSVVRIAPASRRRPQLGRDPRHCRRAVFAAWFLRQRRRGKPSGRREGDHQFTSTPSEARADRGRRPHRARELKCRAIERCRAAGSIRARSGIGRAERGLGLPVIAQG